MATATRESASTAVATTDKKGVTALILSDEAKARIVPLLPHGVDIARIAGEVNLAVGMNPEILQCTPASIIRAVGRAVTWDLTIGETVHLVPFNVNVAPKGQEPKWEKRLQAIQDYKGKIELIIRAGAAKSIDTQVVYAKETFEYEGGTEPFLRHKPATKLQDRGELLGAYAIADHGFNRKPTIRWMLLSDIDAIRKKHSKQWKNDACPPWYAMKTAVHQLAKLLPKNPRMAAVLKAFEEEEIEEALPDTGPVAVQDPPARAQAQATDVRDESCICDRETGEADPNCPIHGDFVGSEQR